jgi:hypothetical protein
MKELGIGKFLSDNRPLFHVMRLVGSDRLSLKSLHSLGLPAAGEQINWQNRKQDSKNYEAFGRWGLRTFS